MTRTVKYGWIAMMMLLCQACVDEVYEGKGVEEGIPVEARFAFTVADSPEIDSRMGQDSELEKKVTSLYALAFDQNGVRSGGGRIQNFENGHFSVHMKSGRNKTLYLIANYEKGTGVMKRDDTGEKVFLDDIGTLEELKKVGYEHTKENATQVDRTSFLMVGSASGFSVGANGQVYDGSEIPLRRTTAKITFRITSKDGAELENLRFEPYYYMVNNIAQGSYLLDNEKDWNAEVPDNYHSMQNGKDSEHRLLDKVDPEGKESEFTFYLTENRLKPAEKQWITEEDRHGAQGTVKTLYALRERRDRGEAADNGYGQLYEQGAFTFAPKYASYVVVYGRVTGHQRSGGGEVLADVYFIVHLGETGNQVDWNNPEKVNNYDTRRNVHYTYNLTISGVHSMHAEVDIEEEENETQPGMEGDLVITDPDSFFDLDAHFNTTVFRVDISQWGVNNRIPPVVWAYSTPFGKGMKGLETKAFNTEGDVVDESLLKTDLAHNDYKWIKFIINRENDYTGSGQVARWPGEKAYDGGSMDGTTPAPALGGEIVTTSWGKRVRVYDVNQLMNRLYQIYLTDKTGAIVETIGGKKMITVTAYIDEYLYTYRPDEAYYKAPDWLGKDNWPHEHEKDRLLWKETVNASSRWLYLATSSRFSPDGATTRANAIVVFSQRPIYTVYNRLTANNGWGTESVVENGGAKLAEGELPYSTLTETDIKTDSHTSGWYHNHTSNGRENTVDWFIRDGASPPNWTDYVDYDQGLKGGENFKLAMTLKSDKLVLDNAPLLRNRDFNGDNGIQAEELPWYLGAFSQLQGLVLGRYSLPRAQLYDQSKYVIGNQVVPVHIASSTYKKQETGSLTDYCPIKVWGEQEGANGAADNIGGNYTQGSYTYRCMRNLGTVNLAHIPDDYVQLGVNWTTPLGGYSKEAVFDLSRMDPNSLRAPFINSILPQGLMERDPYGNSRPSRKFAVLLRPAEGGAAIYTFYDGGGEWYAYLSKLDDIIRNEGKPGQTCPPGYRMPNHGELLLMHAYRDAKDFIDGDQDHLFIQWNGLYIAKNAFSYRNFYPFNSSDDPSYALVISVPNLALANQKLGPGDYPLYVRCVRDLE